MPEQPPKIDVSIHDKGAPERVFREYMENLKLSPEDFNKKILDVGSGSGEFAKWASEHGVSNSIFSIDKYNAESSIPNSVRGDVRKLPFKDGSFELVISNASIPILLYFEDRDESKRHPGLEHDPRKSMRDSLSEMLRVIKPNGEIHLAPVAHWEKTKSMSDMVKMFNEELDALKNEKRAEVEQIPIGRSKYSEGELEEFLYKIKKL